MSHIYGAPKSTGGKKELALNPSFHPTNYSFIMPLGIARDIEKFNRALFPNELRYLHVVASKPHTVTLPPELVDKIIDEIAEQRSFDILATFLLVSRAFCLRARHHLFNELFLIIDPLHNEESIKMLANLKDIMQSAPGDEGILPHVKHVHLELANLLVLGESDDPAENRNVRQDFARKLLDDGAMSWILTSLLEKDCVIEGFTFYGSNNADMAMDWTIFSDDFKSAIAAMFRSPALSALNLRNFYNVPPTIFNGLTIRNLTIENLITDLEPATLQHHATEARPSLPSLIKLNTDYMFPIAYTIDMKKPTLKKLTSSLCFQHDVESTNAMIRSLQDSFRSSLEEIDTNFPIDDSFIRSIRYNLVKFTNLRVLRFAVNLPFSMRSRQPTRMEAVAQALKEWRIPPTLTALQFRFSAMVFNIGSPNAPLYSPVPAEWSEFDKVLNAAPYLDVPEVLVHLQVSVSGVSESTGSLDLEAIVRNLGEAMKRVLPSLAASGRLQMAFTPIFIPKFKGPRW